MAHRRTSRLIALHPSMPLSRAGVLFLIISGCAGGLDPTLFPQTSGGGGGSGQTACDAPTMVLTPKCGGSICHSSGAPQSGLDLVSPGVIARLLDHPPDATASVSCGASTTPYLKSQSNPPSGLLLEKLTAPAPCGAVMPLAGTLSSSERTCLQAWAAAVTTGVLTP